MELTPNTVSTLIHEKALALIPKAVYLRATDTEANIDADQIDLEDKIFVIYNNMPDVELVIPEISNYAEVTWPIEINLLCLADLDDTDEESEVIQDPLYLHAKRLLNELSLAFVSPIYVDSAVIGLNDMVKLYDKTMTGVKLSFDLMAAEVLCSNG